MSVLLLQENRAQSLKILSLTSLLTTNVTQHVGVVGRPRRNLRNTGWFNVLWDNYSEKRFKEVLRVTKRTFHYILENIRDDIVKKYFVCEIPMSCEESLAIALYKFGRGDYNRTLSEMTGWGESTVRVVCFPLCSLYLNPTCLQRKHSLNFVKSNHVSNKKH